MFKGHRYLRLAVNGKVDNIDVRRDYPRRFGLGNVRVSPNRPPHNVNKPLNTHPTTQSHLLLHCILIHRRRPPTEAFTPPSETSQRKKTRPGMVSRSTPLAVSSSCTDLSHYAASVACRFSFYKRTKPGWALTSFPGLHKLQRSIRPLRQAWQRTCRSRIAR